MTRLHFYLTDAEGTGLAGRVSLTPTRRVTVRDQIRLPVAMLVDLDAGEAIVDVMPSTTQWVWRVAELVDGGITRYIEVPDTDAVVEYATAQDVDPTTLDATAGTVAAWETVTRAAQLVADQITGVDDKVTRAEQAAQAAKADSGVAGQEAAKAKTSADAAQTSARAAASSASMAHDSETTANGLIGEARTIASAIETARDTATAAASQAKASETTAAKSATTAKQYADGMAHWIQCADMTDALAKSKQDATALCWWPREATS